MAEMDAQYRKQRREMWNASRAKTGSMGSSVGSRLEGMDKQLDVEQTAKVQIGYQWMATSQ